jgi:hypothetical protein
MSVDRCVTLSFPFFARRVAKIRYMVAAVVMVYIFFIVIFIPSSLMFRLVWVMEAATNRSVLYSVSTRKLSLYPHTHREGREVFRYYSVLLSVLPSRQFSRLIGC